MRASRLVFGVLIGCVLVCLPTSALPQQSDQVIVERILGPQWKQLSRRAGMIFAGTVLTAATETRATEQAAAGATPTVQLSFRVDQAIAGVERGQILTIHEWVGAGSMHRPMSSGQHILLFLYPPSRLGLTSPVGGSLGQVALDPSGKYVSQRELRLRSETYLPRDFPVDRNSVSLVQLERAIRSARSEEE